MSDRFSLSEPCIALHPAAAEWLTACNDAPDDLLAIPVREQPEDHEFFLIHDDGLAVQASVPPGAKPLRVDFTSGPNAHRRRFGGGRQQDLARACGLNRRRDLRVLDATAGLGRDAFVLASLGARVTMMECQPIVWALLRSGLDRLLDSDQPEDRAIGGRMTLLRARAGADEPPDEGAYDVIYLDPMFPERRKSAAVKLDMQLLHRLAPQGTTAEDAALLEWAIAAGPSRVVVKRPRIAPTLNTRTPSHRYTGKSNRFDVYGLRRIPAA